MRCQHLLNDASIFAQCDGICSASLTDADTWHRIVSLLLPAGGYSTGYAHDPEEAAKYTETDKA
jgi:hypothetical protein